MNFTMKSTLGVNFQKHVKSLVGLVQGAPKWLYDNWLLELHEARFVFHYYKM